jgi:hypothetical protein
MKHLKTFESEINEFGFDPSIKPWVIGKSYVFIIFIKKPGTDKSYSYVMMRTNRPTNIYIDQEGKISIPLILGNAHNEDAPLHPFFRMLQDVSLNPEELDERVSYTIVKENLDNREEARLIAHLATAVTQADKNLISLNDPLTGGEISINLIQKAFPSLNFDNLVNPTNRVTNNRHLSSTRTHDRMAHRRQITPANPRIVA